MRLSQRSFSCRLAAIRFGLSSARHVHIGYYKMANIADHYDGISKARLIPQNACLTSIEVPYQ